MVQLYAYHAYICTEIESENSRFIAKTAAVLIAENVSETQRSKETYPDSVILI